MSKDSTAKVALPAMLTIEQVGNHLQVSVRQVHRWIKSGALPASHFGRSVRIAESDLALFITSKKSQ